MAHNKLGQYLGGRNLEGPLNKVKVYRFGFQHHPERKAPEYPLFQFLFTVMVNNVYAPYQRRINHTLAKGDATNG